MKRMALKDIIHNDRASRVTLLALSAVILLVGTAGCNNPESAQYIGSGSAAPAIKAAVPKETETEARRIVEQFVVDVNRKDYDSVRKNMSPALRQKAPDSFVRWLNSGNYSTLSGSKNWVFDLINYSSGGKKLIVHAGFKGADNESYRTNFILSQSGESWKIDKILPPTVRVTPVNQGVEVNTAKPGR